MAILLLCGFRKIRGMGGGVPVMFRGGQEMGMGVPVSVCLLVLTCSIIECFLPWLAGTRTNTAGQNTPCKSTSFNIISIRFISCAVQCNQCGICIYFFSAMISKYFWVGCVHVVV